MTYAIAGGSLHTSGEGFARRRTADGQHADVQHIGHEGRDHPRSEGHRVPADVSHGVGASHYSRSTPLSQDLDRTEIRSPYADGDARGPAEIVGRAPALRAAHAIGSDRI